MDGLLVAHCKVEIARELCTFVFIRNNGFNRRNIAMKQTSSFRFSSLFWVENPFT
jgi:hypothetical protein